MYYYKDSDIHKSIRAMSTSICHPEFGAVCVNNMRAKVTSKRISATIPPTLINEVFAFVGRRIKNCFQSTVVYMQVRLLVKLG